MDYEEELAIIQEEFDSERALMLEQNGIEMNDIADIMFAMDQNFQDRENDARADYESLCDEIKNKVWQQKYSCFRFIHHQNSWLTYSIIKISNRIKI